LLLTLVAAVPVYWHSEAQASTAALPRSAWRASSPIRIAQADSDDQGGVSSAAMAKYVAVYRDMQRDRGLTVKQAAAGQGMSLAEFRKLEGRIERDSAARSQARKELQAAAKGPVASPVPSPGSN
jgi:hypothetical protein